jgi:hypothetical protein
MGPVQVLVVGFAEPRFEGKIMEELERLKDQDVVRLISLLVVYKHDDGTVERLSASDVSEGEEQSGLAAALAGFGEDPDDAHAGPDGEYWYIDDAIPPGSAAAIVVLEHRWAARLRDMIGGAGGRHLADAWVHPTDVEAAGG